MPFGERRETEHNAPEDFEYACNSTLIRTLLWGYNLLTLNIFDAFRAIDYLETRSEVDRRHRWTRLLRRWCAHVLGSLAVRAGKYCKLAYHHCYSSGMAACWTCVTVTGPG